jgi:phosphohistidine swiveling domain-containing protein
MSATLDTSAIPRDPTEGYSEPGRCWTFTNMSEATPDVLTPMCWYLWTQLGEVAARRAWHALGLIPRSMVHLPSDNNELALAPFYGRQALNVDRLATLMGALPGTSREEVETSFLGTARAVAPPDRPPRWRTPFVLMRAPIVLVTQERRVRRLYREQLSWWQRDVLDGGERSGPDLLAAARDRFAAAMYLHARGRFLSQAVQGAIIKMATSVGAAELVPAAASGFGGVAETAIADDLWLLSRGQLSESTFVSRYGFHGSNEGNVTGIPWRVDSAPIRAASATMAKRSDEERPRTREQMAQQRSRAARVQLKSVLPVAKQLQMTLLIHLAGVQVRALEQTKAAFLMAIDGVRAATEIIGITLTDEGRLCGAADAVFLTADEILAAPATDRRELAAFRRCRRDEYRLITLPTTFVGMPAPIDHESRSSPVDELTGAGASTGAVSGLARVITGLDDADQLQAGEILVCPYTDPAWVTAIALADAVVIDVGAPGSHGAIVARELGIPCVIGTAIGTRVIRTGDRIEVDGAAGVVRIVTRAADGYPPSRSSQPTS